MTFILIIIHFIVIHKNIPKLEKLSFFPSNTSEEDLMCFMPFFISVDKIADHFAL